jgi:hypothetical protein
MGVPLLKYGPGRVQTLSSFLFWQKACHLSIARRTGTLDHPQTLGGHLDLTLLNHLFLTAFDTVTFEVHDCFSLSGLELIKLFFPSR